MIEPSRVIFYTPSGLKKFKQKLFESVAEHVRAQGGLTVYHKPELLDEAPLDYVPIVGCHPELRSRINAWEASKRTFIYWDRGYLRRIFATWLPRALSGTGYYRWEINAFQMKAIRDVPDDRWRKLATAVFPWHKHGRHIVVALPSDTYHAFHGTWDWADRTIAELKKYTDRPIRVREKLCERPLADDVRAAHALVTHQSNAAVESVIMGCPVFVDPGSTASLVGQTDLSLIETPVYPERAQFLSSLAYSQFCEEELVNGTLWRLLS